ncbi:MAG: tyramine oxidase [Gemmatimonadota bacterium]|nr:tyramine oxidase [Gemmatimonadota bacterium]
MRRSTRLSCATAPSLAGLLALVFAGCDGLANASQADVATEHPLDPLTAAEYAQTVQLLQDAGHVDADSRFTTLDLREPDKQVVLAWSPGDALDRVSFAVVKQGPRTFEAIVDLSDGSVESWTELEGVQPSLLLEEFIGVGDVLAANPEFVGAIEARGFTMDEVVCAPMTLGEYGIAEHQGRRLLKTPCFLVTAENSMFNRPIEGLWAVVDLNAGEVVEIFDEGVIPVSEAPGGLRPASIGRSRAALEPVVQSQPNGANFSIDGHVVSWDNWTFHYRMEKRSGLVISDASVREGEVERPVLYQGSMSELYVPYMDPNGAWYSRTFMDAGEYGFGANATPLRLGYDCPDTAMLLDAVLPDDLGGAYVAEGVICLFERGVGDPAWRHFDNFIAQEFDGRRAVDLVARMAATIGNYDYFLDWVFTQDGRIQVRIGATGFDGLKGVHSTSMDDAGADAETAYGTLVAPNLVATNHDHFFSFRLDMDVAGTDNSVSLDRLTPFEMEGPRKSGWVVQSTVPRREGEALINYDPSRPAVWRVVNPGAEGPYGHEPGYVLKPGNSIAYSLMATDDPPTRRAGFVRHQLWVTPHAPEERYAAGMYVNQSPGGDGLPTWTSENRDIANTDIVLWYTAGFHHVPRTEDFPVMPSAWHQFELMPFNFFERNPAIDLATDWRGVAAGGGN